MAGVFILLAKSKYVVATPKPVIIPKPNMASRMPKCVESQPRTIAPTGVPPNTSMRYKPITRPRICGSVVVCTYVFAEIKVVNAMAPEIGR